MATKAFLYLWMYRDYVLGAPEYWIMILGWKGIQTLNRRLPDNRIRRAITKLEMMYSNER